MEQAVVEESKRDFPDATAILAIPAQLGPAWGIRPNVVFSKNYPKERVFEPEPYPPAEGRQPILDLRTRLPIRR